jgi:ABC-2 type transport system ATP-binding protein
VLTKFHDGGDRISLDELKYHLTFIPSQPYLFDYLTGNENIEYLMSLFDLEDKYETIKKNLINYSLQNSLNDKVLTYSLGMKAKLFLAVMLEKLASLLLIDELLNNIDYKAQKFTFDLLEEKAKKQNLIILLTSHANLFADKQVKKIKIFNKKLELMQ